MSEGGVELRNGLGLFQNRVCFSFLSLYGVCSQGIMGAGNFAKLMI